MRRARESHRRTLPLGIDVGRDGIRVALAELDPLDRPTLVAVATRGPAGDLGATMADAVAELSTTERRCVFGITEPDACLRAATFPAMTRSERERAAHFEAAGFVHYPIAAAIVRVLPVEKGHPPHVIGVARKSAIVRLQTAAKRAKLRPLAIDHVAFALRRALPGADAILDVGHDGSALYLYGPNVPAVQYVPIGGAAFTVAVAESVGIDREAAERRKRAYGLGGAAGDLRASLIERVAGILGEYRAGGAGEIREIAMVGNGARLCELPHAMERAAGIPTRLATLPPELSATLPADVLRAAAPDWCNAYGLSLWATT